MMKVKELKKILSTMDQELEVFIANHTVGGGSATSCAKLLNGRFYVDIKEFYSIHQLGYSEPTNAVCLFRAKDGE